MLLVLLNSIDKNALIQTQVLYSLLKFVYEFVYWRHG